MEQELDVRELAPPEPLEAILGALDDMPADDWLRVRLSREPFPLYAMLRDSKPYDPTKLGTNHCPPSNRSTAA